MRRENGGRGPVEVYMRDFYVQDGGMEKLRI
jgi:hypothetical protein